MRTIGIEIEFKSNKRSTEIASYLTRKGIETIAEGYNHTRRDHWKVVSDASVSRGWELVSPVMEPTKETMKTIKKVLSILDNDLGCRVDKQCGIHVHVDASGFTNRTWKNLVELYKGNERHIDSLLPRSRRGSSNVYCKSLSNVTTRGCRTINDLFRAMNNDRYFKINLASFWRHNTVEFRQHSGSLNGTKVVNWVKLVLQIVEKSQKRTIKVHNTREEFLSNLFGKIGTGDGPIGQAHQVLRTLGNVSRDEAIEECVNRGINRNTASTQYSVYNNHLSTYFNNRAQELSA